MGAKDMYYTNPITFPGAFAGGFSNQPLNRFEPLAKTGDNATIGRYNSDYSLIMWPPQTEEDSVIMRVLISGLKRFSSHGKLPMLGQKRLVFKWQNLFTRAEFSNDYRLKGLDPETRSVFTLPPLQMWTVRGQI
jgi:hypothetical protein